MEQAQINATFCKTAYKTVEEEKEDGEVQFLDNNDTGLYSNEDFINFELDNKEKILEAEGKFYRGAAPQELERKPIRRDQNGKPIGRGSFGQQKPYDYSNAEFYLVQGHPDRISSQDHTFTDRQRRLVKDDISVDD